MNWEIKTDKEMKKRLETPIIIIPKYLSHFSKEALGWILNEYFSNRRLGKKCKSCGHIQGQVCKEMKINGWKEVRFCKHHFDTVERKMQEFRHLTCCSLYDWLDSFKGGLIVERKNILNQITPTNIFFWQEAEIKLKREIEEKLRTLKVRIR